MTSDSRFIPHWTLQDECLPLLVAAIYKVAAGGAAVLGVAADFTQGANIPNIVLPSWHGSAITLAFEPNLARHSG